MATSAISNEVEFANSKLAIFLRSKEEEEALIQTRKGGIRRLKEDLKTEGLIRHKWQAIDFITPTPMVDRRRTANGATTFHFAYSYKNAEPMLTAGGRPIPSRAAKASAPLLNILSTSSGRGQLNSALVLTMRSTSSGMAP